MDVCQHTITTTRKALTISPLDQTDSDTCTDCPAGKHQATEGSATCDNCEAGKYTADAGVNIVCDNCEAGKYKPTEGVNTACDNCQAGKYSKVTGATSADTCKECPIGTYGNTAGASSCAACPVDETTTDEGNSDPAACECIPGYTRDCTTQVCTVSGARYYASACAAASSPQVSKVVLAVLGRRAQPGSSSLQVRANHARTAAAAMGQTKCPAKRASTSFTPHEISGLFATSAPR